MVQTPVGVRCRRCAQVRRLPQFDVGPILLARSGALGLVTSALLWFVVAFIPFLSFFLAILVGVGVGEVMSRAARRRSSRSLEVLAVVAIVLGLLIVEALLPGGRLAALLQGAIYIRGFIISVLVPVVIASFVAIVKLR
jgi:hypothetical protein